MKRSNYVPNPIDTNKIILSDDLEDLTEFLSKNVHEIWSKTKISEGWQYAENFNEREKKTPYLVSYEDLPEHIKEYDRNSAIQTLKLIISLGYSISKDNEE